MKKNTMQTLVAFLAAQTELPANVAIAADEMRAELAKGEAKAQANREAYATAHAVVLGVMSEQPMTAKAIYEAAKDELPEGFSPSKVQYALLNYWADEVVKIKNAKGANEYRLA